MPKFLIKYQTDNRIKYYGMSAKNEMEAVILHHQKFQTKILAINETDKDYTIESYIGKRKGDYQEILELGDPETIVEEL